MAVWLVGYDAPASRWGGHAMHLPDRANNILSLILATPELASGELSFVGHSMGGLLIKQLLRSADVAAAHEPRAASLVARTRRIAFLSTPHSGSGLANIGDRLRIVIQPSAATASLVRNDPNLRDLNQWYRTWASQRSIAHLVLTETRPMKVLGVVVAPDSADPGIGTPIPIDADHVSITKVGRRGAQQYVLLKDFLAREFGHGSTAGTEIVAALVEQSQKIDRLAEAINQGSTLNTHSPIGGLELGAFGTPAVRALQPVALVDSFVDTELITIRRSRYLDREGAAGRTVLLGERLQSGDLSCGSSEIRARGLAWCARILMLGEHSDRADKYLETAKTLAALPEITVAEAFRLSRAGEYDEALRLLASLGTALGWTAAFIITFQAKGAAAAFEWLEQSRLAASDFDPDGKYWVLLRSLEAERWEHASNFVSEIPAQDFGETPALYYAAALARMMSAVPPELRSVLLLQVPLQAASFPLSSDPASLVARREAQALFEKCAQASSTLELDEAAAHWSEYGLWLELKDPERSGSARERLRAELRHPASALRRLNLAIQFGLPIDTAAVEAEIDRQTALSGGTSLDAAIARFALAFTRGSPAEVADYISQHRQQLSKFIQRKGLASIEVEMLARAGRIKQATNLVESLASELAENERLHLVRIISESEGADPVSAREEEYRRTQHIADLTNLVQLLESREEWSRVAEYGRVLFSRTGALPDAERLVSALNANGRFGAIFEFLESQQGLVEQSTQLKMHWAWALFREGRLGDADEALRLLEGKTDQPALRALRLNLAITSGNWEDLLTLVEREWQQREERSSEDLLRTAQVAQIAGSPRAKELTEYAAAGSDDAGTWVAAYSIAVEGGWESDSAVAQWLEKAASLSDDEGPLQKISLEEIIARQPEWEAQQRETYEGLAAGTLPIFLAAKSLRQSLFDLTLTPALINPNEQDVRRRAIVPAFTGMRSEAVSPSGKIGLDPTALLTLTHLGLLEKVLRYEHGIEIAHSTMAWLFEGRRRAAFHQPSRVAAAREIRDLLATDGLQELQPGAPPEPDLMGEVGEDLALLLAAAMNSARPDGPQTVVVRPYPVHRVASLMRETVDLSRYEDRLVSCGAVVGKLVEKGQLTADEERRARAYLSIQEHDWPTSVNIEDGAVLYLDDVSVSYLQHLGLLGRLRTAGLSAVVPPSEVRDANALLRYERASAEVITAIDELRRALGTAIHSGNVRLSRMAEREESELRPDPSIDALQMSVDSLIIDDRAINRHHTIGESGARIYSSLDLLALLHERGEITLEELFQYRTRLRRAGCLFVPVSTDEFLFYLSQTTVREGAIIETAELRAIRENLARGAMTTYLQSPAELPWIANVMAAGKSALARVWAEFDDEKIEPAADWLLPNLDPRPWIHTFRSSDAEDPVTGLCAQHVAEFIVLRTQVPDTQTGRYMRWLDDRLVIPMSDLEPRVHAAILERIGDVVASVAGTP